MQITLTEAKTELKTKGYSIRTTYIPKQTEVLEILYKNKVLAEFHYFDSEWILASFINAAVILPNNLHNNL